VFALQMMFVGANRQRAGEMADLARSLHPDQVELDTPLRLSPTPPLNPAAMAEIEESFAGLPVVNVYGARIPDVDVLDMAEMRRRRPVEGHPDIVGKGVH